MAYTDTWQADYDKLFDPTKGDLYISMQEQQGYEDSINQYAAAMERLKQTSDGAVAFAMLAWLMANEGSNEMNYKSALDGGALKIQGDLTRLNNDIEDMTNQSDDAGSPSKYLSLVAQRSEQLHQALDAAGPRANQDLINVIGGDAASSMSSQFLVIRQQIYDPSVADSVEPGGATAVYFDTTGTKTTLIQSYSEFQTDLQTRNDSKHANDALKQKTDAFNENTSTTQSTNAASQEKISNDTNFQKSMQAFVVDMFHAIMDVVSASVKAVSKG